MVAVMEAAKNIDGEWLTTETLVERHGKLVHHALKKLTKTLNYHGIEYEDAHSIGMIGLIKAYQNFNPDYGWRFATYAVPMIRGEVRRFMREFNPGVKFPRSVKELASKIKQHALENETVQVIAETLNVSLEKVKDAMDYIQNEKPRFLSDVVYDNGKNEEITLEEQISNEEDFSSIFVQEFMNILSERERKIVRMLMEGYTQKQIGKAIGVTQVQVSRMLQKIRDKYIEFQQEEVLDKQKEERGETQMAKITKEAYETLKQEGKTDKEIAEHFGVKQPSLTYHKTKWAAEEARQKALENKEKKVFTNSEDELNKLKQQLQMSQKEKEELKMFMETELKVAKQEIESLQKRVAELEQEVQEKESLHAACEDVENELEQYKGALTEAERENERLEQQNQKLKKLLFLAIEM
jgi:RNA polymerase sigma factor (sigma-70 family)